MSQSVDSFGGRRRARLRRMRRWMAVTGVGLATLGSSFTVDAANAAMPKSQVVKPDFKFYEGQTITFITGAVGGTQYELVQLMLPYLESYLHAQFKLDPISGNNGLAVNAVASAAPDGLTIGFNNVLVTLDGFYQKNSILNFSVQNVVNIAGFSQAAIAVVACTGSPLTSWQQVVSSPSQLSFLYNTTNTADVPLYLMMQAYHVNVRFISGYTTATIAPGCLRGDGQFTAGTAQLFTTASLNAMAPGLTPLMISGALQKSSTLAFLNHAAPTFAQYFAKHPPKGAVNKREYSFGASLLNGIGNYVFAPQSTSPAKALALEDAFKAVMKMAAVKQGFANLGVPPGFQNPDLIGPALKAGVKREPGVFQYLAQPA